MENETKLERPSSATITRKELMDALKGIPMDTKIYVDDYWGDPHTLHKVRVENNAVVLGSGEETDIPVVLNQKWAIPVMAFLKEQNACEDGIKAFTDSIEENDTTESKLSEYLLDDYWDTIEGYISSRGYDAKKLLPEGWVKQISEKAVAQFWNQ